MMIGSSPPFFGASRRWVVAVVAMLTGVMLIPTSPVVAQSAEVPAPPAALSGRALEMDIALELSRARQNPIGMADDLDSAVMVGSYNAVTSTGVKFWTQLNWLVVSADEARAQPVLPGLRWSETLAEAAREWASGGNVDHARCDGDGNPANDPSCLPNRIDRVAKRLSVPPTPITVGTAIESISKDEPYGKSFVYGNWISADEWAIKTNEAGTLVGVVTSDPLDAKGSLQRGHRGIVGDIRMDAVGVGCALPIIRSGSPSAPAVSCVLILGENFSDAAPNVLGAPIDTSLDQLGGTRGSLGETTSTTDSTLTVDPFDPPPDATLDNGSPQSGIRSSELESTATVDGETPPTAPDAEEAETTSSVSTEGVVRGPATILGPPAAQGADACAALPAAAAGKVLVRFVNGEPSDGPGTRTDLYAVLREDNATTLLGDTPHFVVPAGGTLDVETDPDTFWVIATEDHRTLGGMLVGRDVLQMGSGVGVSETTPGGHCVRLANLVYENRQVSSPKCADIPPPPAGQVRIRFYNFVPPGSDPTDQSWSRLVFRVGLDWPQISTEQLAQVAGEETFEVLAEPGAVYGFAATLDPAFGSESTGTFVTAGTAGETQCVPGIFGSSFRPA